MSDLTLRTACDAVQILAFAAVAGLWLIGGAAMAAYLVRSTFHNPLPGGPAPAAGDRTGPA